VARVIPDWAVEPVVRVLAGAIDVDGGPTDEQLAVLRAFVSGYWGRTDLDVGTVVAIDPTSAGAAITDPAHRRRVRELMVMLELCRHPLSEAQVARVEEYAAALDDRAPDRRNGIDLPGVDPNSPALFVAHDMCHVIAGYEPTGQGEIALGAIQLAVADTDAHWLNCLGNLSVHEAGFLAAGSVVPKSGTLLRPGATDLVAEAFRRGAACTADFTTADHLAMVEVPLADVRDRFGIPPLDN
jgi:hypothetical protein